MNTYTPFGQFQPTESDRVSKRVHGIARYVRSRDYDVTILNSSFPPGVGLVDGHIVTTADAPYQPIADFQLGFRLDTSAPSQSELTPYLKRFAKAAKANMLVISIHQRPDWPVKVDYVEGFAFRSKLADQNGSPKPSITAPPDSPSHSL